MRPPSGNKINQGSHGATKAVDYASSPDVFVYAPEDLTFDSYQQRGSGVLDAGNCLRARGANGLHQFAHLEETYFTGGTVKKGARIAKMGYSGYTIPKGPNGRHLHYWVKTPKGTFVYPPTLYTEPFGGNPTPPPPTSGMPAVGSTVHLLYPPRQVRTVFNPGTAVASGSITVTDDEFDYTVRFVRANRIGIYTKMGGSLTPTDYKELALYYTNGQLIPGWRTV